MPTQTIFFVAGFTLAPIILSPFMLQAIRMFLEGGKPRMGFSPSRDSCAYLFGDTLGLPLAFGGAAYAVPQDGWATSWWWLVASAFMAVAVSVAFRYSEHLAYSDSDDECRLYSPSKMWHDCVTFPVLGLMFCWIGIPVIASLNWSSTLVLAGFMFWVACNTLDWTFRGLKPSDMHPEVQLTALGGAFSRFLDQCN